MPLSTLTPPTDWVNGPITVAMMNAKINALITELQAGVVGGAWQNLVLSSGFTVAGGVTPQIREIVGGGFEIVGWFAFSSGAVPPNTQVQIAAVPSGLTVPVRTSAMVVGYPTGGAAALDIRVDGTIWANAIAGTGTLTQIRCPVTKLPAP